MVSSNIQERFNWEKSRRNKNENNDICLPFYRFFHTKFTVSDLKSKYIFYPNIGSQSFMTNDSEHKFHKTRIENWLSIGFKLGFSWPRTYCHNHYTMLSIWHTVWWEVLNFYIPIFKSFEQSWRPLTSLKLCKCSQYPHPASRVASIKPQRKPTSICLIICKHFTQTKLHHPARCCIGLRGRNSGNKKWNSSTR